MNRRQRHARARRKTEASAREAGRDNLTGSIVHESGRNESSNSSIPDIPAEAETVGDSRGTFSLSPRGASGLTSLEDAKLEGTAIKHGWIQRPFPTRVPKSVIEAAIAARGNNITLIEKMVSTTFEGLESKDPRRQGICERNVIAMETRNLAYEEKADHFRKRTDGKTNAVNDTDEQKNRRFCIRVPHNGLGPFVVFRPERHGVKTIPNSKTRWPDGSLVFSCLPSQTDGSTDQLEDLSDEEWAILRAVERFHQKSKSQDIKS